MNIQAELTSFKAALQADEKSVNTIQKYLHDVRCFLAFAQDRAIDKSLTIAYKDYLKTHYALSSANSMIAALNTFLRFVHHEDCCVRRFKIQTSVFRSENTHLTKTDYTALVRCANRNRNTRSSLLIQTIGGTGIRVSELPFITVEAVKKGEAIVSCKQKTRKVFIVRTLQTKLLSYAKRQGIVSGPVFITKYGTPLHRSTVWRAMKSLCRTANIIPQKVFPHNLRHLFACLFYRMDKDIAKLADLLGHTNINTTRLYIQSTGTEHRRRLEAMHLII